MLLSRKVDQTLLYAPELWSTVVNRRCPVVQDSMTCQIKTVGMDETCQVIGLNEALSPSFMVNMAFVLPDNAVKSLLMRAPEFSNWKSYFVKG